MSARFELRGEQGPELIDPATEIRVLEKTLAATREHAHRARSEDLDQETCRFWQGICGWLRSRIRALENGVADGDG